VTLSLATSARLLSFEDIGSAWSQELKNRVNSTDMVRPAQSKSGSPVFETTGEVYRSQEIIGGGNTAGKLRKHVFSSRRSPTRERRQRILSKLKI